MIWGAGLLEGDTLRNDRSVVWSCSAHTQTYTRTHKQTGALSKPRSTGSCPVAEPFHLRVQSEVSAQRQFPLSAWSVPLCLPLSLFRVASARCNAEGTAVTVKRDKTSLSSKRKLLYQYVTLERGWSAEYNVSSPSLSFLLKKKEKAVLTAASA
ncbi:hypothetical protein chiPu_0015441 [Chiloscyllium punctatum]|uniref:Uncharacterized protein n=1 Tax=Chiloscyllium punctatum TaxID=137246 RepID=A0A401T2R5_CHIPU|nr:hypothetical protein [Chiloscyllium punctatum]